jgi:hypothetical protein
MNDVETMYHIQFNGRDWCTWINEQYELMAFPLDEEKYGERELSNLQNYLLEEGFFSSYFQSKLASEEEAY